MTLKLLKAFRPVNLLIIILTVVALRFLIIEPLAFQLSRLMDESFEPAMSYFQLALLTLSMICIAAGGYLLNDTRDIEPDEANKPGKNIIGKAVSEQNAFRLYYILTGVGLAVALLLAVQLWSYNLVLLHLAVAVSLYFYAYYFKTTFFPGNFIIAFCTACVPLVYGLYEIIPMQMNYLYLQEEHPDFNLNFMSYWTLGFAGFAFLITLSREITKDIEDLPGDQLIGTQSLPKLIGITPSKIVISLLYLGIIAALAYLHVFYLPDTYTLAYFSFLGFLLLVAVAATILARRPPHFKRVSTLNKVISVIGILYAVGIAYMMYNKNLAII